MSADQERRVEELFEAAQALTSEARAAFLDRACAGDAALRKEVESLLAAHEGAAGFMNTQTLPAAAPLFPAENAGDRIGRYKLLEQIGEGGFGVVWMAEQEKPVRRRVALKVIKLGMDTREVVARFEAERQALAMMDHPHIASVFDGGATDTGRPYFVMELVKGVPITDYCDANKLSTRERLALFMQVCHAVQHAHQKGVIHRDLKPSNILVTVKDDRPVPKVIDFGIAKATQARLTEKTLFTRLQQRIGTPTYMSPEQAGLGSLDVDTRSDVYSLGVLLYELLTGRTPFDSQKLLAAGYDAVMRTIREEEPPKPSTRLSTLSNEELSAVAADRGAEPAKLGRLVRGDLDWIVMKALEKDRTRRYDTPNSLSQDVERFLTQKPISAVAPTFSYRLMKFVRRNRTTIVRTLTAGGAATLVTFIALVGAARFYGKGPIKNVLPSPRIIKMTPRVVWERAISDVYTRNYGVTGPGDRMFAAEPYLFVRVKEGAGGWRAVDLTTRSPISLRERGLAYVHSEDSGQIIELALENGDLIFGPMGASDRRSVLPSVADSRALAKLIAVPRAVHGLVVACLPDDGVIFAFDEKSGRIVWKRCATDEIPPDDPRWRLDRRIGCITADGRSVIAGMWSSRIWSLETASGKPQWTWREPGMGNSIEVLLGTKMVFGLSASGRTYALSRDRGTLVWQAEVGRCDGGDVAVLHSTNLILCPGDPNDGSVVALNQTSGQVQWKSALRGKGWDRTVRCEGDLLAVSTKKTVQRFNPFNGAPGTFVELPTLKDEVIAGDDHTPVHVSHPVTVLKDGGVVAFTMDGSLWGLNLPPGAPNDTPIAPASTSGPGTSEQTPKPAEPTPLPPLPSALAELEKELTSGGRRHIWESFRMKIEQDWKIAQIYSRAMGRPPHLIIGRVLVPEKINPTAVAAQMNVLEGGYFSGPVGELSSEVGFRHLGCLPLDVSLAGRVGELIYVGEVRLEAAPPEKLGSIRGRLTLDGVTNLSRADLRISADAAHVNTPHNGSEPLNTVPEPICLRAGVDGSFSIEKLAPIRHTIVVQCPPALPKVISDIPIEPGTVRDLGTINLERPLRASVSWYTAAEPSFKKANLNRTEVAGGGQWQAQPRDHGFDLRFVQQDDQLRFEYFYSPCRLADLGQNDLNPELSIDTVSLLFSAPRGELRPGHVYLFHQQHFEPSYWVLFRIDQIGPSGSK